jgi:hypothetical protein
LILLLTNEVRGQVALDRPLQFTGPDVERRVELLGSPTQTTAAITVEASLLGTTNWAEATITGNTITLSPTVPSSTSNTGDLLRFIAPSVAFDSLFLRCAGQLSFPLLRPDGMPPTRGQVSTGALCEVLFAGDRWVLLNAPMRGCPVGTIQVNDRLCIENTVVEQTMFSVANNRCAGMGGRLCGWGEFYLACTTMGAQLPGIGTAWEWLDDTSNHAHTACQAGNGTCTAQRWAAAEALNNYRGRARCCFEPR